MYDVRWMVRRDLENVLELENQLPVYRRLNVEYYKCAMCDSKYVCMIATDGDTVVGSLTYMPHKTSMEISSIRVHENCHRLGIGTMLVDVMKEKAHPDRRNVIIVAVPERMLGALLFFKKMEFYGEQAGDGWIAMEWNSNIGVRLLQEMSVKGAGPAQTV